MPTYPEPVALIRAKGAAHKSKAELAAREAREIKAELTDLTPPAYLSAKQKREFSRYAEMLGAIGIMKDLDVDCLARYVVANDRYVALTKQAAKAGTIDEAAKLSGMADKAFNQAHKCATALGLTITSRCRLQVPEAEVDDEL